MWLSEHTFWWNQMHENVITRRGCWGNQTAVRPERVVSLEQEEGLIKELSLQV